MDSIASVNEEYSTQEYWDKRYQKEPTEASFDWFKTYSEIRPLMREMIPQQDVRILMLGCGNSTLSHDMWEDGYRSIVNVDYSGAVIEKMAAKHADCSGMEWQVMDIRDLKHDGGTFDVAIDKGTMDALLATKGDVWNPPAEVISNCNKEVDEVLRVLRPNGRFLYLTFGQPHFRKRYLSRPATSLEIRQLGDAFHYYFYILRKETL